MLAKRNARNSWVLRPATALVLLAATTLPGCPQDSKPPPAKKVNRAVDTKKIPVPNHSPQVMSDPGKPRRVSVNGTMKASVGGKVLNFVFFARGLNAASAKKETGAGWLKLRGALDGETNEYLELSVRNFDLSTAELPMTIAAAPEGTKGPRMRMTFSLNPMKTWKTGPASKGATPSSVTLDSFDGKTVKGSFSATLLPRTGDDPLEIKDGTFAIQPRLNGFDTPLKPAAPAP